MKVRLTSAASADIEQAAAWYEDQKDGLGFAFVDRVAEAMENIALNPLGYEKRIKEVCMANVPRFPFALWFRVVDEAIIIGCLDQRRDPALAKERALGVLPFKKH